MNENDNSNDDDEKIFQEILKYSNLEKREPKVIKSKEEDEERKYVERDKSPSDILNIAIKYFIDTSGSIMELENYSFYSKLQKKFPLNTENEGVPKILAIIENEIKQKILYDRGKLQFILAGPPGTSKTYTAMEIAKQLTNCETYLFWEMVQFHPSYTYENFIEGILPEEDPDTKNITYKVKKQLFLNLCKKAEEFWKLFEEKFLRDRSNLDPRVITENLQIICLIIDEINRGNLASIFGELLFGLEYRDSEIQLPNSGDLLKIPKNLVIIGTMNDEDQSIDPLDDAMMRRFKIIPMQPDPNILEKFLKENFKYESDTIDSRSTDTVIKAIINAFHSINNRLHDEEFHLGHTYFFVRNKDELINKWQYLVCPLLKSQVFFKISLLEELTDVIRKAIKKEIDILYYKKEVTTTSVEELSD